MRKLIIAFISILVFSVGHSQGLKLNNVLVIGQFDKPEDRYAIEVNLTELLANEGIKASPSLNILKQGTSALNLVNDSIRQIIQSRGFDTYVVVNVRGYDRKFKPSETKISLEEMLNMASIYHIYRDEATSVSFEFTFFRNGVVIYRDILRCGNVSNRDSVIKRFRKKMPSMIGKKWKA
jgi:hypothetical protein